jgi:hypothetical protein
MSHRYIKGRSSLASQPDKICVSFLLPVKPTVNMYPSVRSLCKSLLFAPLALAQHNASTANGCDDGYFPGTDTVIFTTPYTYQQVMSIIGSFRNITWSGSPYDSVTLNGTDNTVGTARTYNIDGKDNNIRVRRIAS